MSRFRRFSRSFAIRGPFWARRVRAGGESASGSTNGIHVGNKRRRRLIIRCGFLIVAAILVAPIVHGATSAYVQAVSPFVTISSLLATRSVRPMMLVALPVLIVGLWSRRWFCRYACPVGLVLEQVGRVRPRGRGRAARWPRVGFWIVLLTLGGACAGYPLLLWTDPLSIFGNIVGLPWQGSLSAAAFVAAVLLLMVVMTVLWPGSWCSKVCPLGATQDLLTGVGWRWRRRGTSERAGRVSGVVGIRRRSVLAVGVGAVGSTLALRRACADGGRPLRPPGAMSEGRFIGLCERCGNCVRACPEKLLSPDVGRYGILSLMTPCVDFQETYCLKECVACMEACPSGALERHAPDRKVLASIGKPAIDRERCLLNTTECRRCISACPYEALRTRWDAEAYEAVLTVDASRCPGCGACQVVCPTSPKAIVVRPTC